MIGDFLDIHDRVFIMDCRIPNDLEVQELRKLLVGMHGQLKAQASLVPTMCTDIMKLLPEKRKSLARNKRDMVVTVAEILPVMLLPQLQKSADSKELITSVCR